MLKEESMKRSRRKRLSPSSESVGGRDETEVASGGRRRRGDGEL